MSVPSLERLDASVMRAGSVDYLDVWFITHLIEEELGVSDSDAARSALLDALRRLLSSGALRAGDLEPPGEFVAWPMTADEAFRRIQNEVEQLDHPLQVGDIAWFEVPE